MNVQRTSFSPGVHAGNDVPAALNAINTQEQLPTEEEP